MFKLEIENVTSNKKYVGQFETQQELQDWYNKCLQKKSFGVGEVRAGEIIDMTEEVEEEKSLKKRQNKIAFGNKMIALISHMTDSFDQNEAIVFFQKYNLILSYLQFGFLDLASMEIAKVSVQDDNGIEARLKFRLLKEITKYNAKL